MCLQQCEHATCAQSHSPTLEVICDFKNVCRRY